MKYKYIPDTYDDKIDNINNFLELQIKYRESFEKYLMGKINFKDIDNYIYSLGVVIPKIDDIDYNFYHKYSTLGSKYIYLRNNIHIEKLNEEELKEIKCVIQNNTLLSEEFLLKTYEKVLYEDGDSIFFGYPVLECLVKCKSFVFEFAYDQKLCESAKQIFAIDDVVQQILFFLQQAIKQELDVDISTLVYNAVPDEFYDFS